MHRADVEIVERIEFAFIENGYTPKRGRFVNPGDLTERCGLGGLLSPKAVKNYLALKTGVTRPLSLMLHRPELWLAWFIKGFDTYHDDAGAHKTLDFIHADEQEPFSSGVTPLTRSMRRTASRGFRAGWCAAHRLFSKPPAEKVVCALEGATV